MKLVGYFCHSKIYVDTARQYRENRIVNRSFEDLIDLVKENQEIFIPYFRTYF